MLWGPKDAVDLSRIQRALVVKLRHHGDVLLTTPVCSVLKRAIPSAEVDMLVYADTRAMVENHPAVQNVFAIDREWKSMSPLARQIGRAHV